MAKTQTGRVIDAVVGAGVADWFRQAGFRRKGRSFFRPHGELIDTANVQVSKVNMPSDAVFAVNLGVEWPFWHKIWTGSDVGGNPALAPTFVQTRLHPTDGVDRDYWWDATDLSAATRLAADVTSALETHAEAFWERYSDFDALLREFEVHRRVPTGTPQPLVHAALLTRAGRPAEAWAVIVDAAQRAPTASSHFHSIAERLGLGGHAA